MSTSTLPTTCDETCPECRGRGYVELFVGKSPCKTGAARAKSVAHNRFLCYIVRAIALLTGFPVREAGEPIGAVVYVGPCSNGRSRVQFGFEIENDHRLLIEAGDWLARAGFEQVETTNVRDMYYVLQIDFPYGHAEKFLATPEAAMLLSATHG